MKAGGSAERFASVAELSRELDRLNAETSAEARQSRGGGALPWGALLMRGPLRFLRCYLLEGGWRRGSKGLLYCLWAGYYTFFLSLKIWEQRRKGLEARPDKA